MRKISLNIKVLVVMLSLPLLLLSAGKLGLIDSLGVSADEKLEVGDVNVVPLQVTGPAEDRLNLIIFGDGYTPDEMDKYRKDVDRNQNVQWSVEPFRSYRNYFNVYMVETPSKDSGISCDPDDGNIRRDTVFNLQYAGQCPADALARGVTVGAGGAQARTEIIQEHLVPLLGIPANAQNIQTLIIGNTFTYGGIGGAHATTTGGSPQGPLVSLHELGHSLGNLADEYSYSNRGVHGRVHPDREPASFHHTRMTSEELIANQLKWWRWLGEESESGGIIKAADPDGYESGSTYFSNIWRPSYHSMMRHTGYYFDQVGREQMTQRITGMRNANTMPLIATAQGEIGSEEVLSVNTMYPRFHLLDVSWEINGVTVTNTKNARHLALAQYDLKAGDEIKVTVKDKTDFVRDPNYLNGPRMTQTRQWVVGEPQQLTDVEVGFTTHSTTNHALAFNEVAFVETPNPTDRILTVQWELNGEIVTEATNSRFLDLGRMTLPEGASELKATVSDPANPDGAAETLTWVVDNGLPTAPRTVTEPVVALANDVEHNVYFNEFDLTLEPEDDQPGFVVGEIRLNKDGWFNYFGFPDQPEGTPFTFSHSGTDVKELTYGNLGTGGLSIVTYEREFTENDPGEKFVPGFGTHLIEHRAIDATGNIGNADHLYATVIPGEQATCTNKIAPDYDGDIVVDGTACIDNATFDGNITVGKNATLTVLNSTINGNIKAEAANTIQIFGTTVNGDTLISKTSKDITFAGNTFNGWLTLINNNQVSANEQFGEYGPVLVGNVINGVMGLYGNSSPVADFGAPNSVKEFEMGDGANNDISTAFLLQVIEDFDDLGKLTATSKRALTLHITALKLYEQKNAGEKIVKHAEGFKVLIDHQLGQNQISESAHAILKEEADLLVKKWQ